MRVGLFDSGIGGLTVLKELINQYPNNEYIYYADTINLPYGEKTREELIEIGKNIIEFLDMKKVDVIVNACGTCSSLVDDYRELTPTPIFDVITPTVEYVGNNFNDIGLIATKSTIENMVFESKLLKKGLNVERTACPSFVPFIENMSATLDLNELDSLKFKQLEAVILGCTHYPLIKDKIEEYLGIPTIEIGKCVSVLMDLPDTGNQSIDIFVSKYNGSLDRKIIEILGTTPIIHEVKKVI